MFLKQLNLRNTQDRDCKENDDCWNPLLLENLPSLEFLDVSENFIDSWEDDFFTERCPNLTTLYLRSNDLLNMYPGMISTFEHIFELDLANNDFVCSDGIADFHQMTLDRINELEVIDYEGGEGYFCNKEDYGKVSFKQYYDDAKQAELMRILWGALAGILFIILLVAFYVIYHNRYLLSYKVLMARRRFSSAAVDRSIRDDDDDDSRYDYDVFVCYSKEERSWVQNEFLPALESGDQSIRACVHERDFEVGLTVIENIVTCLDRSRRFLMVLSSGFGNSQWCMFEVHLAQQR